MQSLNTDIQSLGGAGGLGGMGGTNPLLWLITLAFLGGDRGLLGGDKGGAGAGYAVGENSAKLDCLAQGQNSLAEQIRQQSDNSRFAGLSSQITDLAGIQRDATAAITGQNNDLARQLADCCCDLKVGQQAIRTDIASQTCEINANTNAGIQRVVDLMTVQSIEAKNTRISELEQQAQTATLAAIVRDTCGGKGQGQSFDVNALASLLNGQKAAA